MSAELVFPSQGELNDRLSINDRVIRVVVTVGTSQTQIDCLDDLDESGTPVVGPFDVLSREVHSND